MGASSSRQSKSESQPKMEANYKWLVQYEDSAIKYASHITLETFTLFGTTPYLAVAYAASETRHEGSPAQLLRFQLSKDGGNTWTSSKVVMWGSAALWCPVLFYDAKTARLILFYSESRKNSSPGGDIKFIATDDLGLKWTPPATIYTHEEDGEVPKVTGSKPVKVTPRGIWVLPYHSEPVDSATVFSNFSRWCPQKEAGDAVRPVVVPLTSTPQGEFTTAGTLISADGGKSWRRSSIVEDSKTWLIQPCVENITTPPGSLLMMFRTAVGKVYAAKSIDNGVSWAAALPLPLKTPNAKFSSLSIDGQLLVVHHQPFTSAATTSSSASAALNGGGGGGVDKTSSSGLSKLVLSLSVDDGRKWEDLCVVDSTAQSSGILVNPCIVRWSDDIVMIGYTEWGVGLKLATIKLATMED